MFRPIQPPAVWLYSIEEQDFPRANFAGVSNYGNEIAHFERVPIPSLTYHETRA
jgi:hypothetical protein